MKRRSIGKAILLGLVTALLVGSLPFSASAVSSDFDIRNGVLIAYKGQGGDVVVPSGVVRTAVDVPKGDKGEYDANPGAFHWSWNNGRSKTSLNSVTLPEGLKEIGADSFSECSIRWVKLPSTLKAIDKYAFSFCNSLGSVYIPNGVTTIGNCAFEGCDNLTSITIPESVKNFGSQIFKESANSSMLQLCIYGVSGSAAEKYAKKNGIKFISISREKANRPAHYVQNGDFLMNGTILEQYTGSAAQVTIPQGVTEIDSSAFNQDPTRYQLDGDYLVSDRPNFPNEVAKASALQSVTIPNTVTRIGGRAFYKCFGLSNLVIPDSVQDIGYEAFYQCGTKLNPIISLEYFYYNGPLAKTYFLHFDHSIVSTITLPKSVKYFDQTALEDCYGLRKIVIPAGPTAIDGMLLYGDLMLEDITLPSTVTKLPEDFLVTAVGNHWSGTLRAKKGSTAEKVAKQSNWNFVGY